MKKICIGIILMVILCGCGKPKTDFKDTIWGMTTDEVTLLEAENENLDNDEYESFDTYYLTYDELIINGKKANVEYGFKKLINNELRVDLYDINTFEYEKEMKKIYKKYGLEYSADPSKVDYGLNLKEEKSKKFTKDMRALINKYGQRFPEEIVFNDYYLVKGKYEFEDLSEKDRHDIAKTLEDKYGKPTIEGETLKKWYTDRTLIEYDVDDDMVFYYIQADAVNDILNTMEKNNKNSEGL
jgi:hypothetical protein